MNGDAKAILKKACKKANASVQGLSVIIHL